MGPTLWQGTEFILVWAWNWTFNYSRACVLYELARADVWLLSWIIYVKHSVWIHVSEPSRTPED